MGEPYVISALKAKREEIRRSICECEANIKAARSDLMTITQALRIFGDTQAYSKPESLFSRGELSRIIFDALRSAPDGLSVNDVAEILMREKNMDAQDSTRVADIRNRVGIAIHKHHYRGHVRKGEKRNGFCIWCVVK